MKSHSDVFYRPACPFCRGQGAANEVTMRNYQRTITYVCSTCMKTWTATDHVPLDLMREERQPSRGSSTR
jgi:transposase-like protein